MEIILKKSKITNWWVANSNLKMSFVNILSSEALDSDLLVVGYLDGNDKTLATSTNRVKKITRRGVITQSDTFYPFKEAHNLYLKFLIEVNKTDILVADNWDFVKGKNSSIIADVRIGNEVNKGLEFDFYPIDNEHYIFHGYSRQLHSEVLVMTFSRRNVCITLGIPESVKFDIYASSIVGRCEMQDNLSFVEKIYENKFVKRKRSI